MPRDEGDDVVSLWKCHNCNRWIHHQGVPQHRAWHRRRGDVVKMTSPKYHYTYDYSDEKEQP